MRVLHVPFCYYPDPVGGTEVYVESLVRFQRDLGIEALIAAPGVHDKEYLHNGIEVYRFKTAAKLSLPELYGEGDPDAAQSFCEVLKRCRPQLLHLHAFTSGVSIRMLRAAHEYGIPVVFTYHTPTVSCVRGTLLRWGTDLCDGRMDVWQCARCLLERNGVPKAASWIAGSLPPSIGARLGALGFSGTGWTALRTSELVQVYQNAVRALIAEADHLVAVCRWVRDLLVHNGASPQNVTLSRQGLAGPVPAPAGKRNENDGRPLSIAFLGRLDAVKGLEVLIDSLQLVPELPIRLDIFAVVQGDKAQQLKEKLIAKIRHDQRICFQLPIPSAAAVERLREYDITAVPSQWMETGPLVVYESFAAGTPVIGSDLGGIAELVQHEQNGILVDASSREAWAQALSRIVADTALLPALRSGIGPVRTMIDVAKEMGAVYTLAQAARAQNAVVSNSGLVAASSTC
jgi:glycosyltransferase involved in cell wall biosynthesis